MSKLIFMLLILLSAVSIGKGQEITASPTPNQTVEQLREKVEEQEQRFNLLDETLRKQAEIIERQQKQIESLQSKIEQKEVNSIVAAPSPSQAGNSAKNSSETAKVVKPSPTPAQAGSVESGFGKIKFDGLIQAWYTAGNGTTNTFRLRRTELKFTGQLLPKVRWNLMIDPSKALSVSKTTTLVNGVPVVTDVSPNQSSRILQDAFITLTYIKNVKVDIGQYKIPLSLEGTQSAATLDTVERALFLSDRSRGGGLGDIRDFGVEFSGPFGKSFDYQIGVFNGVGENQNRSDNNQEKNIIGRIVFRPSLIKGLQIGVSGAWSNANRLTNSRCDRLGGELLYVNGKFKFKTEVMGGVDGDFHRLGFYNHFGYKITPKLEAIFRIDGFDPNRRLETDSTNVSELDYLGGLNYFIKDNNVKLQFDYVRKTFNNSIQSPRNLFLVNLQTAW